MSRRGTAFLGLLLLSLSWIVHTSVPGRNVSEAEVEALWDVVARTGTPAAGCSLSNETRVLLVIPSHGTRQRGLLLQVLQGVKDIALRVAQLDIVLLLTVPLAYSVPHPNVHLQTALFPSTIGFHLVGQFRPFFLHSLVNSLHDIYIMMEDDMAFRIRHLQVFCEAAEVLRGTDYLPGFLRYETLVPHDYAPILENVSPIFLSDQRYHSNPQIHTVFSIEEQAFVMPERPYQAMVVLPRGHLHRVLLKMGRAAVLEFFNSSSIWREYYTTFWVHNKYLTKVVPLARLREVLVHHMSNRFLLDSRPELAKVGITSAGMLQKKLSQNPRRLTKLKVLPYLSEFLAAIDVCSVTHHPTSLPPPANLKQYFSLLP